LASLYSDIDRRRESRLPRVKVLVLNGFILLDASGCDIIKDFRIYDQCLAELIFATTRGTLNGSGGTGRSATESMRKSLVLGLWSGNG